MGLSESDASSTLRIGFGRFNTRAEIEIAAERLAEEVRRIREDEALETAAA
jgi:cysteine sulfinate desulfinase/cysteine desulfurase-like protein